MGNWELKHGCKQERDAVPYLITRFNKRGIGEPRSRFTIPDKNGKLGIETRLHTR